MANRKRITDSTQVCVALGVAMLLSACTSSVRVPDANDTADTTGSGDISGAKDTTHPTTPETTPETTKEAAAETWQLKSGRLIIHVGKTGRLARLGHNHLVSSTKMTGRAWIAADASLRAEVRTSVSDLSVDDPGLRAAYRRSPDTAWAEIYQSVPSAKNIVDTRANMLGPRVLDAKNYPDLYVTLIAADFNPPARRIDALLSITLRDVQSKIPIELSWTQIDAERIEWATAFRVDHSDLGLTPFSALGGALAVAEELKLEVSGVLERSGTVQIDATRVEQESDTQ